MEITKESKVGYMVVKFRKYASFDILCIHMIHKDYSQWFLLKPKLNIRTSQPPVKVRDIWWCSVGINIGEEMDGKSGKASRPVLVYRKLTRSSFMGIPLTSKPKEGSWYVRITIHGKENRVILSQMRIFDTRRVSTRLAQLDEKDFREVKRRLIDFLSDN